MLAALPDFEMESLLTKTAKRLQEVPGQDLDGIRAAIADCQVRGYALRAEERTGRILGLAVALLNRRGRPQSTLTLNAIPDRFSRDRLAQLAPQVMSGARAIEEAMRRMPDSARHRSMWMKEQPDPAGRVRATKT